MTRDSDPLVSIIMPAYNAATHLEDSINSVLAQDYHNWELLLVDDGSTDDTPLIIQGYRDERIRSFRQPNSGVSSARNLALSHMRGGFLIFLDADDKLPAHSISTRVDYLLSHPEVDWVAGAVKIFGSGASRYRVSGWSSSFRGNPLRRLVRLDEGVFFNPSYMLRRYHNLIYRMREDLTHAEDLLFFIELASKKPTLLHCLETESYLYRVGDSSAMSNLDGLLEGYRSLYKHVKALENDELRLNDKVYLKLRYIRIMFLSFLRAKRPKSALLVFRDLLHSW